VLRQTPFHPRTAPLVRAQTWRRWSGFQVASSYEPSHDREYASIRNSAALFDVSPLFKYIISGRAALRMLDRMVTRDVTRCGVGQVFYTTWCDARGKVIDDGTLSRLDENRFRLTSADPSMRWLDMNRAGMDVRIENVSDSTAALALQGPLARTILEQIATTPLDSLGYFRVADNVLEGIPVTISRTGYTGDLGYEIWVDAGHAIALWDSLMRAGSDFGITPAGIWALDVARIEAGLVMLGVDYHSAHHALIDAQFSSPYELALGWSVSQNKGQFNGRTALRKERERGATWMFVGLDIEWESLEQLYHVHGLPPSLPTVAWRTSTPVYVDGEQVGYASSGCWSPLLKKYLALAHVQAPPFAPGTRVGFEVTVEHQRKLAGATVVALPFLDLPRKRA
jgi:aminomethyltransferase